MGQIEFFDTNGKLLKCVGSGTLIARQIIPRDDFDRIMSAHNTQQERAQATFEQETTPKAGHAPAIDNSIRARDLFASNVETNLLSGSKTLTLPSNGPKVIGDLVKDAQRTRKEQGAYIVLRFSTQEVLFVRATPLTSSEIDFTFTLSRFQNMRFVPGDMKLQIIATVHTHFADIAAMNRRARGTGHHFSTTPGVSLFDVNSAKSEKIVVYAIDPKFVHKALPNGQVKNNFPLSLDIAADALDTFGRS